MNDSSDRYAVVGNPVAHSLSPAIHARFAEQCRQVMRYEALLVPVNEFAVTVADFTAAGGRGMNVTLPFKQEAYELVDEPSVRAQRAGAVNTLTFAEGGIRGDNTDGAGLVRDILDNYRIVLGGSTILILGAGGAVQGVLGPLLDCGPYEVTIANRTLAKAEALAGAYDGAVAVKACPLGGAAEQPADLIINAISSGLTGESVEVAPGWLSPSTCCYDMLYARGEATPFVHWARTQGAALAVDGLGMLVEQAAESFYIWRGVRPDTDGVLRELRW
jgi:shikimate dehydrogenase